MTGTEQAHTYDEPGQYTAEVTVTDADGESATEQIDIEVADAPVVEAPRAGAAITVDGRLDEAAWDGASTTSFAADDATDGRDEISALWKYEHLVFGVRVTDDSIEVDPEADRWRNDGIEVFLDPFLDRGSTLAHDDHEWISQTDGELSYSRVRGKTWSPLLRDIPVEHAVERTDTGYNVEVRYEWVPAKTLLEPGTEIGMSVVHNDRDGGEVYRRTLAGGEPVLEPCAWSLLRLIDAEAASPHVSDAPDTGSPMPGSASMPTSPNPRSLYPPSMTTSKNGTARSPAPDCRSRGCCWPAFWLVQSTAVAPVHRADR